MDPAQIEGFAERVYSGMIVVVKESAWQAFARRTPWAVGTIAHVEQQNRFALHPGNSGQAGEEVLQANLRKVWSEFFAQYIAGPLYDQGLLNRYLGGLADMIRTQNTFEIPNHLGRITGHASERGSTAQDIARNFAPYGREYSQAGQELTDLFAPAAKPEGRNLQVVSEFSFFQVGSFLWVKFV